MTTSFQGEPFDTKFEDVSIYVYELTIQLFNEVISFGKERITALTSIDAGADVGENVSVNTYQNGKEVVGKIILTFRNQGEDFSLCMYLIIDFSASSPIDNNAKSVCCKFVQYMFGWAEKYVKENNITDKDGKPFVVPSFMYSKDRFVTIPE